MILIKIMKKIIKKIDKLSREVTKFVIDNRLNKDLFFKAFDQDCNLLFKIYKAKDTDYTCFYLVNDKIEIVHTNNKIKLPISSTKKELKSLYQQLEKGYRDWESLNLYDLEKRSEASKLKRKQEIESELSKLEGELNEL